MRIFINCLVAQLLKIKIKKKKKDTQISQIGYYYFMNIMIYEDKNTNIL